MQLPPSNHSVWAIIRLSVLMIGLTVILYLTAKEFDESELRTILTFFFAAASVEGGSTLLTNIFGKKDKSEA